MSCKCRKNRYNSQISHVLQNSVLQSKWLGMPRVWEWTTKCTYITHPQPAKINAEDTKGECVVCIIPVNLTLYVGQVQWQGYICTVKEPTDSIKESNFISIWETTTIFTHTRTLTHNWIIDSAEKSLMGGGNDNAQKLPLSPYCCTTKNHFRMRAVWPPF